MSGIFSVPFTVLTFLGAIFFAAQQNTIAVFVSGTLFLMAFTATTYHIWANERNKVCELEEKFCGTLYLSESEFIRFEILRKKATELIAEAENTNGVKDDWMDRVKNWDCEIKNLIQDVLPPAELFKFETVATLPVNDTMPFLKTLTFLHGRSNKLRTMMDRLMPPSLRKRN